ncbi:MAG: PIG-L family deacetylase [Candidatus ainarchaeum sp.]|nr:PIG-L family deacetylase [Candidatus ainarchaeum sp.]
MVNALMVVAHPDDETIWAGGFLARNKNWDWTIVSLCRESDADRNPKFHRACALYNAKPVMLDLEDTELKQIDNLEVQNLLHEFEEKEFDFVFTHGGNGEYGHIRHKDTHKAVLALANNGKLKCKKLFFFAYKKISDTKLVPEKNASMRIILSREELESKKKIVAEIYGYAHDSPDVQYCTATEAFLEINFEE